MIEVRNNYYYYHLYYNNTLDKDTKEYIIGEILVSILDNLEHDEPRIQSVVAKILGSYSHLSWVTDSCCCLLYEWKSRSLYEYLEKSRASLDVKIQE